VGPITGFVTVYQDFSGYTGSTGIYRRSLDPSNTLVGNGMHVVMIVGYDDDNNCWIVKNSWGRSWGNDGFGRIAYGQVDIDANNKFGVRGVKPDPWSKRRLHAGNLLESGFGSNHNNFEMVATAGNQIRHWWRNNSVRGLPWSQYATFGNDAAVCPTLISSTFNRNFEIVYLTTSNRLHHWWLDHSVGRWREGQIFGPTDARGLPGFIQSDRAPGKFEVVVNTADGSLSHWSRDGQWNEERRFGNNVAFSGGSLIQSTYGNLETVCVLSNGEMQHWWLNGNTWNATRTFGSNIRSAPYMIEGQYGAIDEFSPGNFELCVAANGQIQHWSRYNQDPVEWVNRDTFGRNVRAVAGLLEGSFGFNLEVIALRQDNQLQHYWRDGNGWHEGVIIGTA
jgi:hypothetical protein